MKRGQHHKVEILSEFSSRAAGGYAPYGDAAPSIILSRISKMLPPLPVKRYHLLAFDTLIESRRSPDGTTPLSAGDTIEEARP